MRSINISSLFIVLTACSAAPSEGPEPEASTARFSLRSEPKSTTDPSESCDEAGVFQNADGRVIVCYQGGVRVAVGDINNADGSVETELTIESTSKHPLPTTFVIPEDARAALQDGSIAVQGARSVAIVPEDVPTPAGVEVAPDCEGVLIDPATGDILICTEATALLLPAVQKVREAAARGGGGGGAGKVSFGGIHVSAHGGAGLDVLIGNTGGDRRAETSVTEDGLGVLRNTQSMAAKAKADILIESLEELG